MWLFYRAANSNVEEYDRIAGIRLFWQSHVYMKFEQEKNNAKNTCLSKPMVIGDELKKILTDS